MSRTIASAILVRALIGRQIVAANEAASKLYRLGWVNIESHFDAGAKLLQLADKATRTVAILTERLDQHRGRGQQQIVVKHVTVNADQAMVAENIVTGNTPHKEAAQLVAAGADKPMQLLEPSRKEAVPVEGGGTEEK
jgi:hypothetical protein